MRVVAAAAASTHANGQRGTGGHPRDYAQAGTCFVSLGVLGGASSRRERDLSRAANRGQEQQLETLGKYLNFNRSGESSKRDRPPASIEPRRRERLPFEPKPKPKQTRSLSGGGQMLIGCTNTTTREHYERKSLMRLAAMFVRRRRRRRLWSVGRAQFGSAGLRWPPQWTARTNSKTPSETGSLRAALRPARRGGRNAAASN